jgi:endonuclease/exonuclease/phosphatase (EEP) superfamily protein YafD
LRCDLETPEGPLAVVTVHLMTPRPGLEAVLHSRWAGVGELDEVTRLRAAEIEAVSAWIGEPSGPLVVAGDFNMPEESTIYRQRFGTLINALGTSTWGYGWTKYTRSFGVRIDHILCGGPLEVRGSRVLRDIGSDHRPVVADLCEVVR